MKVLNLYAGIGGNRKLWEDVEVTAVELDPKIAAIYQDFFPQDEVIVADAHEYLLEHFREYDFIWSSPPCPTHSRFNHLSAVQEGKSVKYPDMTLYQEIVYLREWYKGKYCIENVISYYKPLIEPQTSDNHYFWANFIIPKWDNTKRGIRRQEHDFRLDKVGFNLKKHNLNKQFEKQIINNCTESELGKHILDCARSRSLF